MPQLIPTLHGQLYVGPAILDRNDLVADHYDIIWNLAYELDYLACIESLYTDIVLCGDIEDLDIPKDIDMFRQDLDTIVYSLQQNKKVFVHCLAGCGRTGTALACILYTLGNITIEQALKLAAEYCNGPETQEQIDFVLEKKWLI